MFRTGVIKTPIASALVITVGLLFSNAQAVLPPPDGGYAGGNIAEEQSTLLSVTTEQIETLIEQLREQAAQIQKVSAQHELGEHAPQLATNNP